MRRLLLLASSLAALHCASSPVPRTRQTAADIVAAYELGGTRETEFRKYWIGSNRKEMEERVKRVEGCKDYGVLKVESRFRDAHEQRIYSIGILRKIGEETVKQKQLFPSEEGVGSRGTDPHVDQKAETPPVGRSAQPSTPEPSILTLRHLEPHVEWILVFTDGILDSLYAPVPRPRLLP